ncbi:DnaJ-domain-containing protein [Peniophora sp. CONT]|nr:DnaJ-domain-containing protein [Peniophora sp. CONT]
MESNKDEAQRALAIAQRKRGEGDIAGALKFARKSNALFATTSAASLIAKLESDTSSSSSASTASGSTFTSSGTSGTAFSSATETHASSSGATHRKAKEKEPEKKREYTAENVAVVKRVRACKVTQYYEILDLKKDCEEADVKKAYRKLALALHPDKNGAPGADEAFKMVSKAFQVLSDGDKRAVYDRSGGDPDQRGGMSSARSSAGSAFSNGSFARGNGFESEISPEDLFNMFFGGGMNGGGGGGFAGGPGVFTASFGPGGFRTARTARPQAAPQRDEPLTTRQILTNLLPIILLFAFSFLSALPSLFSTPAHPDPRFSFSPSNRYDVPRNTRGLGVAYHVNSAEFSAHPSIGAEVARGTPGPALSRFEEAVDRAFTEDKYAHCRRGMESKRRRREAEEGIFGLGADWNKIRSIDQEKVEACEVLKSMGLLRG